MSRKGRLVIIRGLPGSGKTTLAKTMKNYKHFEADMFFEVTGEYKFDPMQLKSAHEWCQACTRLELARGNDVVVSNTFVKRWELDPYLKMNAREIKVVEATGDYGSEHDVPQATIERMRGQWEEL